MENKRTKDELKLLQALPLEIKIAKTKIRINEFVKQIGSDDCYISFSGGKDSTVLLDIVRQEYPNMKAIFADTGLEYPEIREFVKTFDNVEIVRPKISFKEVICKYGYPIISKEVAETVYQAKKSLESNKTKYAYRLKKLNGELLDKHGNKNIYNCQKYLPLLHAPFDISHKCCYFIKKKPLDFKEVYPFIGAFADESVLRKTRWFKNGCNAFTGKIQSQPLSFWTEQDVLRYIYINKLPIAKVYGDIVPLDMFNELFETTGCKRTGCVFCGFGCHLEKESRFKLLKQTHPKLYDYCINGGDFDPIDGLWKPNKQGLGMGFVFDWCNENIKNFKIEY